MLQLNILSIDVHNTSSCCLSFLLLFYHGVFCTEYNCVLLFEQNFFFLNAKFMHYQNKPHFQGLLWTHQEPCIPHSQSNRDSASKKGASKMFSPTQDGRIGQSLNLGVLQSWKWRDHSPHLFVFTISWNEMCALQTKYLLKIKQSVFLTTSLLLFLLPCPFES